ncbi:protein FAR1-RELATED SEQUENCE 5-like [Camellia sinensis]|uniref:protein FAR1-RELATED SEQUENCE 5-like n=1 Tax=Camellia sinensis TaxID=4442 RepID=UPI001036338A|nr:protein FAR1-RELATED SEQUENCE 5-like [Camellia sinensis]
MTVTDLFWAHPVSLDLLRTFPRVLIMDCTYKTNRYRLPLLEIVGVTSTHMTFSVAIAYLQTKRVDNYAWALQTLHDLMDDSVLPKVIVIDRELALMNAIDNTFSNARHLLCCWHINKNVLTKCKKMFETKEKWDKFNTAWNYLILSLTEEEYNDHLATLHKDFSNYLEAIKYVTVSWLNRVESAHARLKRQLGSSQTTFEVSFEKIRCLLELQDIQVKASFEKSLTTVQHQFKPSQFRELRGNVSICALEYVLAESKRANSVGIDVITCGCVFRHTHGLPCAHEIADYTRQGRLIPLSSIHELREIENPASTFLIEPDVKPNPRRGHKKIDISCRRDPCAFELVDDEHDSQSTLASSQSKKKRASKVHENKRNVKTKTYRTRTSLLSAYAADFPPTLIPFIKLMKDVDGDGNCGFKAIVGLLGLGENDRVQVRRDLLLELNNHRDEYVVLYGSHERVKELTHILSYFENSPGFDRWMTMPDMGHLIASFYNVVLYHLSLQQYLTFLSLRSPSITLVDRREIAIGFVNENHFVQVFLEAGHPVPPIAVLWRVHHHPCASE